MTPNVFTCNVLLYFVKLRLHDSIFLKKMTFRKDNFTPTRRSYHDSRLIIKLNRQWSVSNLKMENTGKWNVAMGFKIERLEGPNSKWQRKRKKRANFVAKGRRKRQLNIYYSLHSKTLWEMWPTNTQNWPFNKQKWASNVLYAQIQIAPLFLSSNSISEVRFLR